jgi:hypothetical protein
MQTLSEIKRQMSLKPFGRIVNRNPELRVKM